MTNNKLKHSFGWRPDTPDLRDKLFKKILKPIKLPPSVDLRKYCSKVEDQGDLGSCTAHALVGALEFLEIKDRELITSEVKYEDLSRLFIYYNERVIENTVHSDSGAELRDGIKTLVKQGACLESCCPYDISKFTEKPHSNCYTEGLKHKVTSYHRILTVNEMKICLASNYPFVFGFSVYSSFETEEVANTGIVPMPNLDEQLLGGHAVLAVGYNDKNRRFLVRNSWGEDWGGPMKGYFEIPYNYLADRNLSEDFWNIRKQEGF